MELDKTMLDKILKMNDGELSDAFSRVALGLGLDESLLRPYLARTDLIRGAVERLTPEDLRKVAEVFGEERIQSAMEQIRNEVDRA